MVAERLGVAQLTFAQKVDVEGSTVTIQRATETGYDTVEAAMPAVVSVVEKINEPRYPSFKGIMAAKKKPVETLSDRRCRARRLAARPVGGVEPGRRLRGTAAEGGGHGRHGRG